MSKKKPTKSKSKVNVDPKDLEYYMGLNYPIVLTRGDNGDGWYAAVPLMGNCMGNGATPDLAVADVLEVLPMFIEEYLEDGILVPELKYDEYGLHILEVMSMQEANLKTPQPREPRPKLVRRDSLDGKLLR